jgi:PAS domain-containing protein
VLCLRNGITIVFQNAFYLPILIIALYYPNRGLFLAVLSSALYLVLFITLGPGVSGILPALIRVLFYLAVSCVTVHVSTCRLNAEQALRHHLVHLEEIVEEQTRYISEKLERSRQLGEAFRKGNEYYEQLFKQIDTPTVIWNPDLYITDANNAFSDFFKHARSELKGRRITDILPFDPEDLRNYPVQLELPSRSTELLPRRSLWIISRVQDVTNSETRAYIAVGMDLPATDTMKL